VTRRALSLLAIALALPVAACGDGADSAGTATTGTATTTAAADASGTPLTNDQAQLLASAQFLNYRNKGAEFTMDFGVEGTGTAFTLKGQMDWDQLIGYGTLTPEQGTPFEVWWRQDIVVQSAPDLATVLQAADQPPVFIGHKPNPLANPVDKAIAILLELGSKKRDNPLLVQQKKGSAYLGEETIRDTPALVLRYGEINRFWIDPETGLMLRFAGDSRSRPYTPHLVPSSRMRKPRSSPRTTASEGSPRPADARIACDSLHRHTVVIRRPDRRTESPLPASGSSPSGHIVPE
jgi:hypothetical protein